MKKLLLVLVTFFTICIYSQEVTKEELKEEFKTYFKANKNEDAFLTLNLLESLYGVDAETSYYSSLLCYYTVKDNIKRKNTIVVFGTISKLQKQIEENKLSEKQINNLKYLKVLLNFGLLYHFEHKNKLDQNTRKNIADTIIKESNNLLAPYILDEGNKETIESVLKRTKDSYDFYTGPIEKIGM